MLFIHSYTFRVVGTKRKAPEPAGETEVPFEDRTYEFLTAGLKETVAQQEPASMMGNADLKKRTELMEGVFK